MGYISFLAPNEVLILRILQRELHTYKEKALRGLIATLRANLHKIIFYRRLR